MEVPLQLGSGKRRRERGQCSWGSLKLRCNWREKTDGCLSAGKGHVHVQSCCGPEGGRDGEMGGGGPPTLEHCVLSWLLLCRLGRGLAPERIGRGFRAISGDWLCRSCPIHFCSVPPSLDLLHSTHKDSLCPSEGRSDGFYIGKWRGQL